MWQVLKFLSSTVTSLDQKRPMLPLRPTLATPKQPAKPNEYFKSSTLLPLIFVSVTKRREGPSCLTILRSSRTVSGFPSPRQFHTRRFIDPSGADPQPPPIQCYQSSYLHHPVAVIFSS